MNTDNTASLSHPNAAPKSISRWLITISALGTALAMTLLMGTSLKLSYNNSIALSTHSHTAITAVLGTQVAGGLRGKKQEVVNAALKSTATVENYNLALAQVYDSDGELWLAYMPESHNGSGIEPSHAFVSANLQTEVQQNKLEKTALTVVSPLFSDENNLRTGTLVAVWDLSAEKATAQQVWITGALLALVCLALLLASQWWAITHRAGRPLRKITAQMAQLASGNTDVDIEGQNRADEIGAIAKTVEAFRRDAVDAEKLRREQLLAAESAEQQRKVLDQAAQEKQLERTRELKDQRTRADSESEAAKSVQKRIEALLHAVDAAAHGNLDYVIDCGAEHDDLQQIALALNNMFKELRQSFDLIGQQSSELNASAKQLKSLGETISSVAGESTSRTTYASEKSVHVSATVETVASATHQMGASIEQIAMNAGDAAKVASQAVQLAENTDVSIRKLSESSNGIGKVIKVINSIAEQTNLLALNATIEAARAGDAGKGFAVVANEVKELAKETANATEEIEKRIASIQTDTGIAVQAIADINQIVRQISETQQVIATSVEEQTETTQEINRTIVETSKANDEINSVMDGVVAQTQSACDSAANVETAAARLEDIALSLDELLRKFRKKQVV